MPSRGAFLDNRWVIALLALAAAIPLVWPPIPPLVDLLGHMGRYKVELDGAAEPALARGFAFEWRLIGNLGVDLLIVPFGRVFGIELGTKLIVIGIVIMTATGMVSLSRQVHGRIGPAVPAAIALIYSYPFHFGFINYAMSIGLVLHALALWLRLEGRQVRAPLFVILACVIWVTHTMGWGLLGLSVFGIGLVQRRREGQRLVEAGFRAGWACLPLAVPMLLMLLTKSDSPEAVSGDWFNWATKLVSIVSLLRDRWQPFDVASATLVFLIILMAARDHRFRIDPLLGVPALLCVLAFIAMPRIAVGSAYADMRLLPYICILALIGIINRDGEERAGRVLALVTTAFLAIRVAGTSISFFLYSQNYSAELRALDALPRGASVLAQVIRPCDPWTSPREEHLPSLATVRRGAFTNDQWSIDNAQLIRIIQPYVGEFGRDPSQIIHGRACRRSDGYALETSVRDFDRRAFTHVWTINAPPGAAQSPDLRLIWTNGRSALYLVMRKEVATS
jgi:hypothetical protein